MAERMLQGPWARQACHAHHLLRRQHLATCLVRRRSFNTNSRFVQVSEEVQQAVAEHRPVVALETTVYTHGYPYPDNLSLASRLESLVRTNGGVPATIGILDGIARVGLGADELVRLVSSAGSPDTLKISRRDFGFALGLKGSDGKAYNGGTTIAGTMVLAHMAGIKVFATGGLGGVHRGAETTMDVSADLTELGRTPVAVISSGCKAFLDIPKTLEYLETHGVAVATFADGRGDKVDFPAFWTRESGVPSPYTLKDESHAAQVLHAHLSLGLQSGLHFANPIPEYHSLPLEVMESAIYEAIKHADVAGAVGAAATPYILSKIREVTGNQSLAANTALLEANIIRGAKVARQLNLLEREESHVQNRESLSSRQNFQPATNFRIQQSGLDSIETIASRQNGKPASVFVAGSLAIDLSCDFSDSSSPASDGKSSKPAFGTSNPSRISQSLGGVGSNVARAVHLMGADVRLCSAIGDDLGGKTALEALTALKMSTSGVATLSKDSGARTAQYVAINDSRKDLLLAMADMAILESSGTTNDLLKDKLDRFWLPQLRESCPTHLVLDGNWSSEHLGHWLAAGNEIGAHIVFEPVSNVKSTRLFGLPQPHSLTVFPKPSVHMATPNAYELSAMYAAARETGTFDRSDWWQIIDALGIPSSGARTQLALATSNELVDQGIPQQSIQLLPFFPTICTKLGSRGVLLTQIIPAQDERLTSGEYAPYILSRCANESEGTLGVGGVYMRLFPAIEEVPSNDIASVNGVGDSFVGTLVAGLAKRQGARVEDIIDIAQRAAILTLKSEESVSPGLGTLRILL